MYKTPLISSKRSLASASFLTALLVSQFVRADFDFFGNGIDYWKENPSTSGKQGTPQAPSRKSTAGTPAQEVGQPAPGNFPWAKYIDPANKEFFREGEYTPPEPFMEIVRNPSDQNLKMWFAYIDKKNQLAERLRVRMQEFSGKSSFDIAPEGKQVLAARMPAPAASRPDLKRYRFCMYFDSHCPHCKKMFETLSKLQGQGFYVEARQVDNDSRGLEGLSIPVTRASPQEIKDKNIQSVPVLLIGDLEKKAVYPLRGYHDVQDVFRAINEEENRPEH